ncbi:MAG TPA: homocysteine S-methyltransferase family protein, partial [Candidatus Nitrosopolaris sp.]|nr:homocysteine S-methyltransferase family protein [Candidatus Nitrosopolaris sp.]
MATATKGQTSVRERLDQLFKQRIVIFDGSIGVLLQKQGLNEEDWRGERFRDHPKLLKNNVDILNLSRPDVVSRIHREYLEAGADLITTNTFTATPVSQADYGLEDLTYEINFEGARLAREAAGKYENRFVAGSLGPTNVTLSLSPKVEDPSYRDISFDELRDGYAVAARALRDGGVDFLLIETIFDTLNGKAAIAAVKEVAPELPLFISVTIVDRSGRNLSGQTVEAFWNSIEHAEPFAAGINCSLGATEMRPYIEALSHVASTYVTCYPNAGLPNSFGGFDEDPPITSRLLREFAASGFLNAAGGCCGTTPDHIRQIRKALSGIPPRKVPGRVARARFSGLEPFEIGPDTRFVVIGERTNVTGSLRFRRLIESGDFTGAVQVALDQVRGGANLLDVNMDADLLDSEAAMTRFLNLIATEPEIARIPIMVDSSKWSVLEAGLKCLQGKGVCNSISLKEGEESFLEKARLVREYGAAVVVMAFDEKGQADTFERKVGICERAYKLLIEKAGYHPEEIIFDPNILAIATG